MSWLELSLELDAARAERFADALMEVGALSVDVADAHADTPEERPIFGEPGLEAGIWRVNRVSALFDAEADVVAAARAALASAGIGAPPPWRISPVAPQDWVRATQQQFAPVQISARLWIVPSWCEEPDPAAVNLRLDPGLAFGTGTHATTWQCLRWLDDNLTAGASVLDYGCGSGVLAIAAKRLGAGMVVAVDIDPTAVAASRANARANAVEIEATGPDAVPPGFYDVVLANILANPLRLLAPLLAGRTRPGGAVVLAGILHEQAASVEAAYAQWYDMRVASEKDGWTCLAGVRRS